MRTADSEQNRYHCLAIGTTTYFLSFFSFCISKNIKISSGIHVGVTIPDLLLTLRAEGLISRLIRVKLYEQDIFNKDNETFPQEEGLVQNENSINLPAKYSYKKKVQTKIDKHC